MNPAAVLATERKRSQRGAEAAERLVVAVGKERERVGANECDAEDEQKDLLRSQTLQLLQHGERKNSAKRKVEDQ